jgi:phosphoadenosine phosphosulfate reductase
VNYKENILLFNKQLDDYKRSNKKCFVTSSFQTQSVPLLHIISKVDNTIPVYFIDTAFLFAETYQFKEKLQRELKLNIIDIKSPIPHSQQLDSNGFFHYASNPDHCCYLNKVMPLDSLLKENNVWMTGVRKDQTLNRATMEMEEPCKFGSIVFRPMLEWTSKDIYDYIREYDLPKHPLEKSGYVSIGCVPCTTIGIGMDNRESRWQGQNKTECGLHN